MNKLSIVALACAALLPLHAAAQNVAIVNGKAVPKARLEVLMQEIARSGQQPVTPELEKRVRDEVVWREIFMQEAERRGLAASPEYRQQMELLRQQALIRVLLDDVRKKSPVTDGDAKAEYDRLKTENASTEYRARHILVETEDEAKSLLKQLSGGANFEDLARKHSKDSGSGANGGDLDFASPRNYVPEFSAAMVKLKKGEMTETPVKTQFGWHIIKVEDTRESQFPAFEEVKPQVVQRLQQKKFEQFRNDLKAKTKTDYTFASEP